MATVITVSPGPASLPPRSKPGKVILYEQNPEHPGGEVFVYAPHEGEEAKTFKVARTGMVQQALGAERLVEGGSGPHAVQAHEVSEADAVEPTRRGPGRPRKDEAPKGEPPKEEPPKGEDDKE